MTPRIRGSLLLALAGSMSVAPLAHAGCADLALTVRMGFDAYSVADVEAAKAKVAEAYAAIACQTTPVAAGTLLELYRVDGLVALSLGDARTLDYASMRAVAADPVHGRPPDAYGPDLQAQFDAWSKKLASKRVAVRVIDEGTAWIDGRSVDAGTPLEVVVGEHVVQLPEGEGVDGTVRVRTDVRDVQAELLLTTGLGGQVGVPVPVPVPVDPLDIPVPHPSGGRRHPIGLVVASGLTSALGGLVLASAFRSEAAFHSSNYLATTIGDCERGDPCYAGARADAIRSDALRIDLAYGVGYGLAAASGGLLVVTVVGLPPKR